jgi:hypothetical protein
VTVGGWVLFRAREFYRPGFEVVALEMSKVGVEWRVGDGCTIIGARGCSRESCEVEDM